MLNDNDIRRLLPHRSPMALLDGVVDCTDARVHARFGAAGLEFHSRDCTFARDADGFWPWALVLEAWCQAAAIVMTRPWRAEGDRAAPAVLISRLTSVRMPGAVALGETVDLYARITDRYPAATALSGYARVGSRRVLEVERLTASLRPFDDLVTAAGNGDEHG
ncbi:hypothetical protein [Nocardia arizonensis]|uniref:hypothetical protein n=1 Tax=Nocardia arizonensis TaxID=1141647 RepID=UPI0006CFEC90|nr:hypothetical protein [Nocardia arizonensis]